VAELQGTSFHSDDVGENALEVDRIYREPHHGLTKVRVCPT
jgi:hypothetical protein